MNPIDLDIEGQLSSIDMGVDNNLVPLPESLLDSELQKAKYESELQEQEKLRQESRRVTASIARKAMEAGHGEFYDYATALEYENRTGDSLYDPVTGHWASRVPDTGLLLKSPMHPTADKMYEGEAQAGYAVIRKGNREYSVEASRLRGGQEVDRVGLIEQTRARLARGEAMTDLTHEQWGRKIVSATDRAGLQTSYNIGRIHGEKILVPWFERTFGSKKKQPV